MTDDTPKDDTKCYECGHTLSEGDIERDKCPKCGRHYHDDLEDYEFEEDDD